MMCEEITESSYLGRRESIQDARFTVSIIIYRVINTVMGTSKAVISGPLAITALYLSLTRITGDRLGLYLHPIGWWGHNNVRKH